MNCNFLALPAGLRIAGLGPGRRRRSARSFAAFASVASSSIANCSSLASPSHEHRSRRTSARLVVCRDRQLTRLFWRCSSVRAHSSCLHQLRRRAKHAGSNDDDRPAPPTSAAFSSESSLQRSCPPEFDVLGGRLFSENSFLHAVSVG